MELFYNTRGNKKGFCIQEENTKRLVIEQSKACHPRPRKWEKKVARAIRPGHPFRGILWGQRTPRRRNATEVMMAYTKKTSISHPMISLNSSFTTANMAMAQKGWIISVNMSPHP